MKLLSMRHQILFLISAGLCFWVSCQKKEMEDPRINEFINNPDQDTFDVMVLPQGETITLSQEKIVVREYGEINGTLLIEPNPTGEFSIVVLDGNLTIAGEVRILETSQSTSGRMSRVHNEKAADGMDNRFIVKKQGGELNIKRSARIFSGNGKDAPRSTLSAGLYAKGTEGGEGGDIILDVPNGDLNFEKPQLGDPAIFYPGNGGRGGDLWVDRNFTTESRGDIALFGGKGGDGGQILTSATAAFNILTLAEMFDLKYSYFGELTGLGGDGGHAVWDNTVDGIKGDQPELTSTLVLSSIFMQGGDGGNSLISGGTGGSGIYWCDAIINPIGEKITSIHANGGKGGDVVFNFTPGFEQEIPIPVYEAWGGDGGYTVVYGNHGWHGDRNIRNGADGGYVYFVMGNGGDVKADVRSVLSYGGAGGGNLTNRAKLPPELGLEANHQSVEFWIMPGRGGKGVTTCDGCPGGKGGDTGKILEGKAGKGGDVLNEPYYKENSRTGDGGNIWNITNNGPGDGGNGNLPGKAGCVPEHNISLGTFGASALVPLGKPGERLDKDHLKPNSTGDCGDDGEWCGQDLVCNPVLPPKEYGCWRTPGTKYIWSYKEIRFQDGEAISYILESGTGVSTSPSFFQIYFFRQVIKYDLLDTGDEYYYVQTEDDTTIKYGGPLGPICDKGIAYAPGENRTLKRIDPITKKTTVLIEHKAGGCQPDWADYGYDQAEIVEFYEKCTP